MGSLQITPTKVSDEEANYLAMELACGSALPMVLKTAIEHDLLEIMAKAGPGALLSPKEMASQLPTTHPDAPVMLDRILRLLASYSVLNCSLRTLPDGKDERLYGLGPVCKFLTKNEDGASLSALSLLLQDQVMMESWHYMKYAVLEGGVPFNKPHDMTIFQYLSKDSRLNMIFNKGMVDLSIIAMKRILETYDGFEGINTLVDIGGGTGVMLSMIVSKYPTIKGINFDLPHVIENAPTYPGVEHVGGDMFVSVPKGDAILIKWVCHGYSDENCLIFLKKCYEALPDNGKVIIADSNLPDIKGINFDLPHVIQNAPTYPGVEHVGGNMFVSVPKGDAIFIKWVCHGFSDEHCSMFLKKCYEALPDNGKVIIADSNLPDHPDSSFASKFASFFDCFMLVWNTGKERTKKEFEALAKGAGFQGFQVKCTAFGTCIMEFHKSV